MEGHFAGIIALFDHEIIVIGGFNPPLNRCDIP
jgi:hypothetical protein